MLSRTAANLFWMARYLERAETAARLLEVGERMSLIPGTGGTGYRNEWVPLLQANGSYDGFVAKYRDPVQRNVESFMFFDRENPGSVAACLSVARENARIVRTALTGQVWDALNTAYQELMVLERTERSEVPLARLTEWTLRNCTLVRGALEATQLRNDGYEFLNIGFCIERADNTARLLDVKYFVLLPRVDFVGSGLDDYQWTTLLRSMSAHRAFHWAYRGEVTAAKIAHFLILNRQAPRSLLTSVQGINDQLDNLARAYGVQTRAQELARGLLAGLSELTIDEIFDEGLHEFLTRFIGDVLRLGSAVYEVYLSGDVR